MTNPNSPRAGIGGPKTPEGKRISSMNALKHGLSAVTPQAEETMEKVAGVPFHEVLETMRQHYRPKDPVEDELVRRIARCTLRLKIAEGMETRRTNMMLLTASPDDHYMDIMKFERLVDIHLHRAIRTLMRKRELDRLGQK